jgi:crotonobetainyl-CoA:carnitine CoA-transferase CaiB-like acyl-CoA transferase
VYVRPAEPAQWHRLLAMVPGAGEFARSVLDDPEVLRREATAVDKLVRNWVATQSAGEVVERCQAARVPLAEMARPEQLVDDPHLQARHFYTGREPRTTRLPWLERRRPTGSGGAASRRTSPEPRSATRPLDGIRVLDLSWAWAGPFATTLMAELGAEILNVEWLPRPSNLRVQPPLAEDHGFDASAWWSANQRGKASIGVDFKHALGRQLILDLAAVSDAVVENFSPGVVDRLGIGFDELSAVNDSLVYVSMSAYGGRGPHAHFVGYGTQLYAASGFSKVASSADGEASQMIIPLPDPISGLAGAVAVVAHLGERKAVHLDVSELEATCLALLDGVLPDMGDLAYDADQGATGSWLIRSADGESSRQTPVASIAEMLRDERLTARNFWQEDRATLLAGRGIRLAGAPWLVHGERPAPLAGAPSLFGDTRSVLRRTLGWSDVRIDALAAAGAIRTEPPS